MDGGLNKKEIFNRREQTEKPTLKLWCKKKNYEPTKIIYNIVIYFYYKF